MTTLGSDARDTSDPLWVDLELIVGFSIFRNLLLLPNFMTLMFSFMASCGVTIHNLKSIVD